MSDFHVFWSIALVMMFGGLALKYIGEPVPDRRYYFGFGLQISGFIMLIAAVAIL